MSSTDRTDHSEGAERGADPTIEFHPPQGHSADDPAPATEAIPSVGTPLARTTVLSLTFLAVAAAGFLIGIAVASSITREPAGTPIAAREVGRAGGTIRFDGGEVRIPAGALSKDTRITVRRTTVSERVQVRPPGRPVQVFEPGRLVAYIFEPPDVDFLRPITLIFRLRDTAGEAAAFARVGDTTLLLTGGVDTERGTVAIEVSDFRFNRGQPVAQ